MWLYFLLAALSVPQICQIDWFGIGRRNWDGQHSLRSVNEVAPRDVQEVVALMDLVQYGEYSSVKVVGSGHSWSDIAVPASNDTLLIHPQRMDSILDISRERMEVRAQAGVTLQSLNKELAKHGLALPIVPSVEEQTIAGAIATSTHATGLGFPNLSAHVRSVTLVTATGEIVSASREQNEEVLQAAACHLGALGVITEVTISVVDAFNLHVREDFLSIEQLLNNFDSVFSQAEHVKVWVIPHSGSALVTSLSHTDKHPHGYPTEWQLAIESFLGTAVWRMGSFFPSYIPVLNKLVPTYFTLHEYVVPSDTGFLVPYPIARHQESEFAIPFESGPDALRDLLRVLEEENWMVNHIFELRSVKGDDILMSSNYKQDSLHVTSLVLGRPDEWRVAFFRRFEAILDEYGGRPHWGKSFEATKERIRELFPKYLDFDQIRRTFDPKGVFRNRYLQQIFSYD